MEGQTVQRPLDNCGRREALVRLIEAVAIIATAFFLVVFFA
jgi:hypothetical protein